MYHVSRNGAQQGPHSIEVINQMIAARQLSPSDLAWQEGMTDWVPLSSIPGVALPPPVPQGGPPALGSPYAAPRSYIAEPAYSGPPVSSGMAIASMILGILCVVLFFTHILALIMGLLAVIFGHLSRGKILRSNGRITGGGMALAGLITGYIGLVLAIALIAFAAVFVSKVIDEANKDPKFRRSLEELKQDVERASQPNQ